MATLSDFDEIRPYAKGEMKQAFNELVNDRQFKHILKGFVPFLPFCITKGLLRLMFIGIDSPLDFQKRFMKRAVRMVLKKCSDGSSFEGHPMPSRENRFTFMSNHRDIVLDSAILDLKLLEKGYPTTCEIAIGDNLLIYPWIRNLVKMNKAFTVRRSLSMKEMMKSSVLMSEYIHYAINEKKENIWIAQREGRAKDSNDRTQESVLKMLAYGHEGSPVESLKNIHIVPLTISYEFDPCDYLKAAEFQLKRDNPEYKKTRQDDLDNMKIGIMGYKGRVHYECSPCIDEWLDELKDYSEKDFFIEVAKRIDKAIHSSYKLYPANYIAADLLSGENQYASYYTKEDFEKFDDYLSKQLAKINIPDKDEPYLKERMLTMYANPLKNFLEATKSK